MYEHFDENNFTIKEASNKLFNTYTEKEINKMIFIKKNSATLLKALAETERFKNLKILNIEAFTNTNIETQFAAMTIEITNNDILVVFRGTDTSVIGWKEDFNMSYLNEIPGQKLAVNYLNSLDDKYRNVYVTGHSKGGNLAIYSSNKCNNYIKIQKVVSFDSPGFNKEFINNFKIKDKIKLYVPEFCIVGMLFEQPIDYVIVKSSAKAFKQHDLYTWEVFGNDFIKAESLTKESISLDESFNNLIYDLTIEQKEKLSNTLFGILEDLKIIEVEDFFDFNIIKLENFIKVRKNLTDEQRKIISETFKLFFKND